MTRFIEFTGGDVEAYLHAQEQKDLLRFITCGSVDDGKSTLIGRLLYEAKMLFEDQLTALEADSKKMGTQGGNLDCKELTAGSTIYLPVWNEGALFSTGDGHAAQGDGEVDGTAIETALTGTFEFNVKKKLGWRMPRAMPLTKIVA